MKNSLSILLTVVLSLTATAGEPVHPQARAHAHNDYAHGRPLLDALDNGFCSVEADIFLVNEQLLVGHTLLETRPERTLETLYLAPLRQRVTANGGRVHPNGPPFWLLIDIKTDAAATYGVLELILAKYADILTEWRPDGSTPKAVSVVVSGNRPRELIAAAKTRYAAVDGRLPDLKSTESADLVPWISDNWTLNFRWRGEGEIPDSERQKLRELVERAHQQRRRVRFWATPDLPAMWRELLSARVDFINTDDLAGLAAFLAQYDRP